MVGFSFTPPLEGAGCGRVDRMSGRSFQQIERHGRNSRLDSQERGAPICLSARETPQGQLGPRNAAAHPKNVRRFLLIQTSQQATFQQDSASHWAVQGLGAAAALRSTMGGRRAPELDRP